MAIETLKPKEKLLHALISIGANLSGPQGQTPAETCCNAVTLMERLPHARVGRVSPWYQSAPVPPSDQPHYVNGVALLHVESAYSDDPALLLKHLMAIEAECGRQRSVPNAARMLDLDIIAMDGLVRQSPDPVLPHPRAHLRAFVLRPLLDVMPDWVHPALQRSGRALLATLPPQPICLLS